MKKIFLGLVLGGVFALWGCADEDNAVGENLLGTESIDVKVVEQSGVLFENQEDNTADLSKMSTGLLGTLNDEVFGKTRCGMAFQLRLEHELKFEKPEIDSVKLFLAYDNYYGLDTTLLQNSRVFLLQNSIEYTQKYSSTTDITSLLGEEVGQALFNKDLASDTIYLKSKINSQKDSIIDDKKQVDTVLQHLTIKLDNEKVGKYIVSGTKKDFSSGTDFINFFKGFYVNTDDVASGQGAIYGFNVYRSFMMLYYKDHTTLSSGKDTIYSSRVKFPITDNSARFNLPKFTPLKGEELKNENIYLQGIHGTKVKVKMPFLDEWKNKESISINKAELVFKVATDEEEAKKYALPQRLALSVIGKDGKRRFLNYSSLSGAGLNGLLNSKDRVYTFQIPEYLQNIVEGKENYDYFELSVSGMEQRWVMRNGERKLVLFPVDAKNIPARVVLYGSGENEPKLNVTYTKY